jgi:phosphatidylserine/phosphatidylglycerophosphate/cardiolipin synthase-like enzyme
MPAKLGNITMYMGPKQAGGPDDLEGVILDFINGAKKKLDIAVQELDNANIAKAIIAARNRKVRVRLVLEADYLVSQKPRKNPWKPGGANQHNREILVALLRSAIWVRSDFNSSIFHQKFIVRDGSAVLMGSTNFTVTGTTKNLNHLVVFEDRKIANIYKKEFGEIAKGHFGKLNEGHDPKPKDVLVSNVRARVAFAPDHAPEMEIMKQMMKAQKRIDFAIFTFSKSSGIDDTMIAQTKAGIKVTGALDGQAGNQKWAATRPVKNAGAALTLVRKSPTVGKLHHKLMVIDDEITIIGSFNYTGPANLLNDENIIVLGDKAAKTQAQRKAQTKLAKYARAEIDRIVKAHA